MKHKWPITKLGEVLTERRETPTDDDLASGRVRIVEKISFDSGRIHLRVEPLPGSSGDFSLRGIKIEPAQVEKDIRFEAFLVAIAVGFFNQSLDFIVQSLNRTVGQSMHKICENIAQVSLAHPGHFLHRL